MTDLVTGDDQDFFEIPNIIKISEMYSQIY